MTCTAEVNINFISTSHHHESGVLEQFFCKRFAFDRYFYHELQKKKKTFCKLCKPLFCIETVATLLFFLLFIFEVKDTFRNVDFTIPHNVSNHFHSASVWIRLNQQQHCLLSQHWKNNDNNNKNPLKCLPLPFLCACSSAAPQDIILWPFQNQSRLWEITEAPSGSELQFHKASFLLEMLNCIFTHLRRGCFLQIY